ncbi:C163A protein, partial [Thalassarche chlororhynchos]|nr:C163A protein [Thalassarche chlororhynchos]
LRLVDGGGRCAGRVEVKHNGEWGSVCNYDFDWDARWATVVCRQLGCGSVAKASSYAPFGQGTGRIWLQPFFCSGDEAELQDCPHFDWGQHFCSHESDVGVTCTGEVGRLAMSGHPPCAGASPGRAEAMPVPRRGRGGSVADNIWDREDAEVVCQQLGCGSATTASISSTRFGQGDGPINLVLVDCRGDEAALWDCEIRGWGPYVGTHNFDTAVVCQGFARLVGGDGACAGRLEVRQGQAWASVCEDHVDIKAAQVVCRELGCGTALAIHSTGWFEAGTGPLWELGFECTGTEPLLASCARRPPHSQGCTGHASIICSCKRWGCPGVSGGRCDGWLEVAASPGSWARVLAGLWDARAASVVCRQLGCGVPEKIYAVPGSGTAGLQGLRCAGTEENLAQCNVSGTAAAPTGSPEEVAIVCSGECPGKGRGVPAPRAAAPARSPPPCPTGSRRVRLVGGPGRCAGRVEVYVNGTWGTICQETWDLPDATVVCRQLGCGTALAAPGSARFGPGTGPLWPDAGGCTGTEASLWDC